MELRRGKHVRPYGLVRPRRKNLLFHGFGAKIDLKFISVL